jgi:hypothetical protein
MAIRITCIRKAGGHHENPYVAISHLQWVEDGTALTGEWTRERMYDWVENQGGEAYVRNGLSRARLMGAISPRGTRYVKTEPNHTERDNLLKLPACL